MRGLCQPVSCDEEYTSLKLCAWYSPKPGQHIGRERNMKLVRAPKDLFHPRVNRVMQSPLHPFGHSSSYLDSGDGLLRLHHARGLGRLPLAHLRRKQRDFGDLWRDLGREDGRRFCGATMKNCAGKKLTNCVDPRYRARKSTPSMRTLGSVTTGTAKIESSNEGFMWKESSAKY